MPFAIVLREKPTMSIPGSTTKNLFDRIIEPGDPDEYIEGGFSTREKAFERVKQLHEIYPLKNYVVIEE